jgi:FixJ family two-component response regulator
MGSTSEPLLVVVVDDDESIREALPGLLGAYGFDARAFSSAESFLESGLIDDTGCLILDVAMPTMSGPALQQELVRRGHAIPIVFITANVDPALHRKLRDAGAVDVLPKPFTEVALIDAVTAALRRSWH